MSKLFPIRSSSGEHEEREPELLELDDDRTDEVFDALGSETARQILLELHEGPQPASDLAAAVDTSIQNVQYHLTKLEAADLVVVADTWYAENGAEMDVYAPTDEALVLFAGTEPERSLRKLLKRLVGVLAPLAVGATALWLWLDDSGVPESEPSGGSGGAPIGDGGDGGGRVGDGGSGDSGDGGDGGDGGSGIGDGGDGGDGSRPDTDPASGTDSGGVDGGDGGTGLTETHTDPSTDAPIETPTETPTPNGTATDTAPDALDTATAVGDAVATPALDLAGGLGAGPATVLVLGAALVALGGAALVRRRNDE